MERCGLPTKLTLFSQLVFQLAYPTQGTSKGYVAEPADGWVCCGSVVYTVGLSSFGRRRAYRPPALFFPDRDPWTSRLLVCLVYFLVLTPCSLRIPPLPQIKVPYPFSSGRCRGGRFHVLIVTTTNTTTILLLLLLLLLRAQCVAIRRPTTTGSKRAHSCA